MSSDNLTSWFSTLAPVDRSSAGDAVRNSLKDAIESGALGVGDKLPTEAELSQAFSVSRPVVRQALESLRVLGLVETRAGRGTFVLANQVKTPLVLGQCTTQDLHEVRLYLEVPAARLCATRRSDEDIAVMDRNLDEHRSVTTDVHAMANVDIAFHMAIARASRNPLLPQLIGHLRQPLEGQTFAVNARAGRLRRAIEEHAAILDAIRAGDAEGAAAAMERHLKNVGEEIELLGR
jgi:GntR family transcriptional regulator, transcriptional repressor for pyruvate dehydrogenase complex